MWCADAVTSAADSKSNGTDSRSRAKCRGLRPGHCRAHISTCSQGWPLDEFRSQEELWVRWARTPRNAWRTADYGIDGVSGSFKPVYAPPSHSTFAVRPGRQYSLLEQDAEKVRQHRSRLESTLNVAQRLRLRRFHRLRPCRTSFLSILRESA